jgi:hypothetical protein
MASLGQILRQIFQGQSIRHAFLQAKPKPKPGAVPQTLIGASRMPKLPVRDNGKVEQLMFMATLAATVANQGKSAQFNLAASMADLQLKLSELKSLQGDLAEFAAMAKHLDRLIDQMTSDFAATTARMETMVQMIDASVNDNRMRMANPKFTA